MAIPRPLVLFTSLATLLAGTSCPPARASTPQAWRDYNQQVLSSCVAASSLRQARAVAGRVDLPGSDGALTSVLLLEGKARQPHLRGRRMVELCLYDQGKRQARVADAAALLPPSQP
ncbi:MAG: hypothetical protein VKK62_00115 [Synechococcaceae cyanobacterium]|nr:hypothetical protein [Synechococcaceae cyanobacterium]